MATSSIPVHTDWRQEWFEFEDATYLNLASQSPMPKVSLRAIQSAIADNKHPHHRTDSVFFEIPNRIRANIAQLIGAKPEEIAVTTGASAGVSAVAYALDWKPGDEVITAAREFPLQYTIWKPMEEREGIKLKVVAPRERFITADDLIAAMRPRTRVISVAWCASMTAQCSMQKSCCGVPRARRPAVARREPVLRRNADECQRARRRFSRRRRLQMAARAFRHWIFLGQTRVALRVSGAVLLDGGAWLGQFRQAQLPILSQQTAPSAGTLQNRQAISTSISPHSMRLSSSLCALDQKPLRSTIAD